MEGEGGLKKTKLLTVVEVRKGGWVKKLKNFDGDVGGVREGYHRFGCYVNDPLIPRTIYSVTAIR